MAMILKWIKMCRCWISDWFPCNQLSMLFRCQHRPQLGDEEPSVPTATGSDKNVQWQKVVLTIFSVICFLKQHIEKSIDSKGGNAGSSQQARKESSRTSQRMLWSAQKAAANHTRREKDIELVHFGRSYSTHSSEILTSFNGFVSVWKLICHFSVSQTKRTRIWARNGASCERKNFRPKPNSLFEARTHPVGHRLYKTPARADWQDCSEIRAKWWVEEIFWKKWKLKINLKFRTFSWDEQSHVQFNELIVERHHHRVTNFHWQSCDCKFRRAQFVIFLTFYRNFSHRIYRTMSSARHHHHRA